MAEPLTTVQHPGVARAVHPVSGSDAPRARRGAKALVRTGDSVLLVRERHADGSTFWTLPGGGVDPDESLRDGLQRELNEELGCRAVVDAPLGSFQYAHRSKPGTVSTYTVFDCALLCEPEPNHREGVLEHRWVDPATLPPSTLPQVSHLLADGTF